MGPFSSGWFCRRLRNRRYNWLMHVQDLNPIQREAAAAGGTSFLYGPAGTGKTTTLHQRLLRLLGEGEPAYTILTLVAEPELWAVARALTALCLAPVQGLMREVSDA